MAKKDQQHPWRMCPLGSHWRGPTKVRSHYRKGKPVKEHFRAGSCVANSSHLDQIYEDELQKISQAHFNSLDGPPVSDDLGYKQGNDFDAIIRGWTKYWNEVIQVNPALDANLVKALIATESSFDPTVATKTTNPDKRAIGLMQVTGSSQKILEDEKGELKDNLVNVSQRRLTDPTLNVAAGIRILFRKMEIARKRNGKASWLDAIQLYKGYSSNHPQMKKLEKLYKRLTTTKTINKTKVGK